MDKQSKKIPLYFNETDRAQLKLEADRYGLALSSYLRLVILGVIKRGDTLPKDINK